jgi:DHA1 family bicyclomycin/chloramphenicol resistance-like MFS transporter
MTNALRKPSLITLILVCGFASFNAILAMPAIPQIALTFHITDGHAQSIMAVFLLGYVFGQLVYGPLSNRYGRIPSLLTGLGIGFFSLIVFR